MWRYYDIFRPHAGRAHKKSAPPCPTPTPTARIKCLVGLVDMSAWHGCVVYRDRYLCLAACQQHFSMMMTDVSRSFNLWFFLYVCLSVGECLYCADRHSLKRGCDVWTACIVLCGTGSAQRWNASPWEYNGNVTLKGKKTCFFLLWISGQHIAATKEFHMIRQKGESFY